MRHLIQTERVGHVLVVTLNRPELNQELIEELSSVFGAADLDIEIRAIVLTGKGPVFCAGVDADVITRDRTFDALARLIPNGAVATTPVVAALNGSALAEGFELMMACDLVVAAQNAQLGMTQVQHGSAAFNGGLRLAERIPMAIALEMGLTGDPVSAAHALQLGLVNRVVPADRVLAEALALARRIADNGPLAALVTKKLIRERRRGHHAEVAIVLRSTDLAEGERASAEGRAPVWTGR